MVSVDKKKNVVSSHAEEETKKLLKKIGGRCLNDTENGYDIVAIASIAREIDHGGTTNHIGTGLSATAADGDSGGVSAG